ncbi:14225_t:CDS:2, partial [Entrophospora sp. SA101]
MTDISQSRNSTTSFLTATTLIYAIGAGITAAANTRLALQLFLVKAVSQAPSPESNPNSPLPVKTMVGLYPTIK